MNRIKLNIIFILLIILFGSQMLKADYVGKIHKVPAELKQKFKNTNPQYWIFKSSSLPKNTKAPLLINLHGGGQKGSDIKRLEYRGKLFATAEKNGFITAVPQCLKSGGPWNPEELNQWLEHLKKTQPIDPNRIYLIGFSMGGYGTWAWAAAYPKQFAAISPNAGGLGIGGPKDITPHLEDWAKNIATIPTWAIHGEKDKCVPADRSRKMVNTIKRYNPVDVRLSIIPDQNHSGIITQIVNKDDTLFKWFLSKNLKNRKAKTNQ